jgi:hypothetical protein
VKICETRVAHFLRQECRGRLKKRFETVGDRNEELNGSGHNGGDHKGQKLMSGPDWR